MLTPLSLEIEQTAREIVDAAFTVHSRLGPGLLESVYELCLVHELRKRNLLVEQQVSFPIRYDGIKLESGFRLDLLIDRSIIVELKAVEGLHPIHEAQLLTYLKLTGMRLGFLINFNVVRIRDGIRRRVL